MESTVRPTLLRKLEHVVVSGILNGTPRSVRTGVWDPLEDALEERLEDRVRNVLWGKIGGDPWDDVELDHRF